ncbi:t-SNARE [Gigaspora rosea]|uniref:t-SNARE n=1 Tax=Gigaspora rosea TaxID=44941 RepID=A0A397VTG4_9GLOM|nr:t-SNARE [Gigaspora rosea]CAG8575609.1 21555_t:CDS:2 [Gigaspora rosea]
MSTQGFLEETKSIEDSISTIQQNIDRIQELQTHILGSTSSMQEDALNKERSILMGNTKDLLFQIKDRIKKIGYENAQLPKTDSSIVVRKQRHLHLHDKFNRVLDEYRRIEDIYMKLQKDRIIRQYKIVNPAATQEEIDNYVSDSSNQPVFQHAVRTGEARTALAEVQKRHGDIKEIENTISELVGLFTEMQLQVEEQDPVLDHIEESVDGVTVKLEQASKDIEEANKSALGSRKKKWILFGVIFVVILIIIAIIIAQIPKQANTTTTTVPATNIVTVTRNNTSPSGT